MGGGRPGARIVEEQAALRRVALLVARAAPPEEVFAAVAAEAGRLLDSDLTVMGRYDADGGDANAAVAESIRAIARTLGVSRNTVRRYLRTQGLPRYRREARATKLDWYKHYIDERVKAA